MMFRSIPELLDALPDGALVPVAMLRALVATTTPAIEPSASPAATREWRERLHDVPDGTLLSVAELAQALGRPRSSIYRWAGPSAADRIPSARVDGRLQFQAGDVRRWLNRRVELARGVTVP